MLVSVQVDREKKVLKDKLRFAQNMQKIMIIR